jgi:DNA-binding NarL/FixJ family response regulator
VDQPTGMADTGSRDLLRTFGPRDVAVLRLLADGRSTGEIAARLSVSSNTARTNIRRVQKKLDVRDRATAVRSAADLGVLQFPGGWLPALC